MNRVSATRAVVRDTTLMYQQEGRQVTLPVGSSSWFSWLQTATSFTFKHDAGSFTARKTRASNGRGNWYWYVYRRQHGRLFNLYLGTSEHVTLPRLHHAAHTLTLRVDGTTPDQSTPSASSQSSSFAESVAVDRHALLTTKLRLPRLPVQHISRPRLLARLQQAVQRPVTLVHEYFDYLTLARLLLVRGRSLRSTSYLAQAALPRPAHRDQSHPGSCSRPRTPSALEKPVLHLVGSPFCMTKQYLLSILLSRYDKRSPLL